MLSDRSRDYWDFFISECVRQKTPLYFRLAKGVRDDEALSALVAKVRASQPMANARDWLKALVWPDHRERFRRLEDALSAVEGLAVEIRPGDALGLWRLSMELSDGVYPLKLGRYADGAKQARILGFCDPQGGCLEWRGETPP